MAIKDLFTLGRQGQAVNSANGEFVVVGNQNEIVVRNNKNQIVSTTELQGARPYGNYQVAAVSNDAKKAYITTWNGYLTTSGAGGVFEVDLGSGRTKRLDVDKNNSTFTYQGWSVDARDIDLSGDNNYLIFAIRDTADSKTWGNQETKIYRKNLLNDEIIRIDGTSRGGYSGNPRTNNNGTKILFTSNLKLTTDNINANAMYLAGLDDGKTILINKKKDGTIFLSDYGWHADLSADGNIVVFQTGEAIDNSDTNGISDIYMKNIATSAITRVSLNSNGGIYPFISPDAKYIAYQVYNNSNRYLKLYETSSGSTVDLPEISPKNQGNFNSESIISLGDNGGVFWSWKDYAATDNNNDADYYFYGLSTPTPTYTLTSSAITINEGSVLTTLIATTNVASSTTLYYSLSGTGINSTDFLSGALRGSGAVGSNGSFSFSHTLANDLTTEGTETLNIKLYSDSSRSTQIGSTASVLITDTSKDTPYVSNLIHGLTLHWNSKEDQNGYIVDTNLGLTTIISGYALNNALNKGGKIYIGKGNPDFNDGYHLLLYSSQPYKYSGNWQVELYQPGELYLPGDYVGKAGITKELKYNPVRGLEKAFVQDLDENGIVDGTNNEHETPFNSIDIEKSIYTVTEGLIFNEPKNNSQQVSIRYERNGNLNKIDNIKIKFIEITAKRGTAPIKGTPGLYYDSGEEAVGGDYHNYILDSKTGLDKEFTWARLLEGQKSDGIAFYLLSDGIVDGNKEFLLTIEAVDPKNKSIAQLSQIIKIVDADAPNYFFNFSQSLINEGSTLTTSVATTNVASGSTLYYSLSGTGINSSDFSSGSLTGSGSVASNGTFSFSHTLANDLTTEGTETLNIKLFSDSSRSTQVGSTAAVSIADTSVPALPTFSVSTTASSINEGDGFTTTLTTTGVAAGTAYYWVRSGSGITSTDFIYGGLSGSTSIGSDGKFSYTHLTENDLITEGDETVGFRVFSDSNRSQQVGSTVSILIRDTSITPAVSGVTVNGNNSGIANSGTITNNGTINTGTQTTNSNNTTTNTTNNTNNNINNFFTYYTNTTNNTNSNNTVTNTNSNNTISTWNIYRVDNSVKAGDIVSQWFGTAAPTSTQLQDISETKLMDVVASTWTDKVQINRVVKASDTGGKIEAKQIEIGSGEVAGSVVSGGKGSDDIKGFAGWDNLEGGDGNDLIHGGNGRDIISGGAGRDELHGDFGWNTYKSEKDGVSDLIAIKSDHYLVNWLYGKAGNSPNGEKADIIEGLDSIDKIKLIGIDTREITFAANISAKGVTGIGIYGKGILEALYTGGDLTVAQITQMTSGDASAAAMSNSVNAYGVW